MARQLRIQFEGAFYHVYHRGNRHDCIFLHEDDYKQFEKFLFEAVERSGVLLYDWSLMPNHFHLVVETPRGNLAQFMSRLLTRYAMYFNWRYKTVGHVFQGRYGARLCDKEVYFLALILYVELNPYRLKDGLSLAAVGEWKWSARRFYMGEEEPPEACREALEEVLSRFGRTLAVARTRLAQYLSDGLKRGDWTEFYKPGKYGWLGDADFVAKVNVLREYKSFGIKRPSFSELTKQAALCFKVNEGDLRGATQAREISRSRHALMQIAKDVYGFSSREIAANLLRSESAVSMALQRERRRGIEQPETNQLWKWLEIMAKIPTVQL